MSPSLSTIQPRDSALVSLDVARMALDRCANVMDAKKAASGAEAAVICLERAEAGSDTIARAREIQLRAERKLGTYLLSLNLKPGRPKKNSRGPQPFPTLSKLGISKDVSSRAQVLALMPEDLFETYAQGVREGHGTPLPRAQRTSDRIRRISQFDSRLQSLPAPEPDAACAELITLIGTMQSAGWRGVRPQMARLLTILTLMARRDGYSLRVVAETALLNAA